MEGKAFIEKIVVEGFKSYGTKKREILLGEGFIGIVGPNGAGKSNIGDAISFALALSTARALRAKNLSHLIFSKNGKKAEHAYVEIHFKNLGAFPVDSDSVIISRKVTKEGRSTFKINGTPVRERDLKDFLAKAGIYENAYNVVYQGDIVKFLKMTPTERRKIIEEVAGIGEYERKKEKALEDLAEVELKIKEIKLILDEINFQLERLKQEAERLRKFKTLKEEIKKVEKAILLKEEEKLILEKQKIEKNLQTLKNQLVQIQDEISQKESFLQKKENKLKEINETIIPYKEKIGKFLGEIELYGKEIKEKEGELKEALQRKENLIELLENLQKDLKALNEEIQQLDSLFSKKKKEYENLKRLEEEKLKELEKEEEKLKVTLEEVKKLEEEKKLLSERLENIKNKKTQLEISLKELKLKIEKEEENLKKLEEEIRRRKEEFKSKEEELKKLKTIKSVEEKELKRINEELRIYENRLKEIRKELEEIIKEKGILEDKVKSSSEILEAFYDIPGVHGTVAQLIKVKDPNHIQAIEVAGGGRLKYIVVENENVAKECIEKAKKLNLGRFSFIPLNRVRVEEKPLRYPRVRGAVDFAINLVEYDPKYEKAVKFVFGDTLIVEDFESAKLIGIGTYRMVTLEGELFEKTGIISGGNVKSSGELGSKYYEEMLRELEQKESKLKDEEERISKKIRDLRNLSTEKFALLKVLDKKINELLQQNPEEEEKRLFKRLEKAKEYIEHLQQKEKEVIKELESVKEEEDYIKAKLENLKLKESDVSRYYSGVGLEEKRREYSRVRKKVNELYNAFKELENKLNKKRYEAEYLQKEISDKEKELSYLTERIEILKKEINEKKEKIAELKEEVKRTEGSVYSLFKEKETLEEEITGLKAELGSLKIKEEELKEQINNLEKHLISVEDKLKNLKEQLENYRDVTVEFREVSVSKLKEKLQLLQEQLKGVGNVNFAAEDDYRRELERYEEYRQKQEKLKEESKAIREMIEEIEKKKKKVFMEAYSAINKSLKKIFSFLSPGGKAQLLLENEEDPFSGGVYLTVKPRGKDVQYLEAMSGGEKTLAALSLIFAIQEYKPSPFYYFDEVDAHLDEVNAKKVGELIREKAKEAQFIVVTLREIVASFADRIIAVTARGGISETFMLENKALEEILEKT